MGNDVVLKTPISEDEIRKLKAGDTIYVTGTMVTARDEAHKELLHMKNSGQEIPVDLNGLALYHCGPIIKKENDEWKVVAAGPTTSARMEMFEADFIKAFKVRVIIGKGGLGPKTTKACQEYGAVYAAFTGGAAIIAANAIRRVKNVYLLEKLGMPEALWVFEVERFGPLTVAIDTHGTNLFEIVSKEVEENISKVYKMVGIENE
ncbi:MAG: fumarate hydratase [Candidatus Asgardarchaeum californiense]|nr:MAG: fumarate hydratase [Candidatus Asgardarchaeum californiense]